MQEVDDPVADEVLIVPIDVALDVLDLDFGSAFVGNTGLAHGRGINIGNIEAVFVAIEIMVILGIAPDVFDFQGGVGKH